MNGVTMKATITNLFDDDPGEDGVSASDGTRAVLERDGDTETLRVRNAEGALVFEHRPAEGRSIVYAPHGDLTLRAEAGSIDLEAADAVRIKARRDVSVESESSIHLMSTTRNPA